MRYIAALDVGTTTVRCHIIDENTVTVGSAAEKVCHFDFYLSISFYSDSFALSGNA